MSATEEGGPPIYFGFTAFTIRAGVNNPHESQRPVYNLLGLQFAADSV